MASDEIVRRSADAATRLRERSARLSLEIERQIANRDGPLNYILACAHQEAVHAYIELGSIDPTQVDEIRKLQNRITLYSEIGTWLSNAVNVGNQMFRELQSTEIPDGWIREFSASDEDTE